MIEKIKILFTERSQPIREAKQNDLDKIPIATCALLLEMAHADSEFSAVEKKHILNILMERYAMEKDVAEDLLNLAEEERKESLDLWQFTNLINKNFTYREKLEVVETLWKVIFIDGKIDKYEDYLIRKLTLLLDIKHEDMIDAKIRVRQSFES